MLFVDNCPSHPKVELTNITLEFLPPKTTSLIQPCDGGIIKVFKGHYRSSLQSQDGAKSEWFDTFMSIESHVLKQIETQAKVQPKITSFFSHGNASESQDSNNN